MEFFLLGFGDLHGLKYFCFTLFLLLYLMALTVNLLVIILVVVTEALHCPMYFFLSQLSSSEILFTTNIVPNLLRLVLFGGGNVSVSGCRVQFFVLCVPTVTQCILLAAMSFDRHAAISNPLHYTSIVTFKVQLHVVIFCWSSSFMMSLLVFTFFSQLQFCRSNIINHFYCDISPVMELSCSDTSTLELVTSLASTLVIVSPCFFIIGTYISIIVTITRIPSKCGRQKAFSTCSSHLAVVCMYYGTLISIYIYPPGNHSVNANKFLSLLYTFVTPLFNPIIYCLRNQDIRSTMRKYINIWGNRIEYLECHRK
ncbi:olfactory receptor 6P1-like [Xenopus tropicalis]|uniref:Olfactory receptor 6P1-like n=1 Tax=Xenopus tropicalis TaxID=8364 RepID=A0A8J1J8I1_XENTR|nr:olfactory receptor 6P1-like [Xenopus tropicalis]